MDVPAPASDNGPLWARGACRGCVRRTLGRDPNNVKEDSDITPIPIALLHLRLCFVARVDPRHRRADPPHAWTAPGRRAGRVPPELRSLTECAAALVPGHRLAARGQPASDEGLAREKPANRKDLSFAKPAEPRPPGRDQPSSRPGLVRSDAGSGSRTEAAPSGLIHDVVVMPQGLCAPHRSDPSFVRPGGGPTGLHRASRADSRRTGEERRTSTG
jgi:hypothetical protein